MSMHSDERRIAALLRELITQDGAPVEAIESRLGWEPGRLGRLLGGQDLSFDSLLEILPALDATPGDFFARLHTYDPAGIREERSRKAADRRFEESRRVVKAVVARRLAEKTTGKTSTAAPAGAGAARDASSGSG